MLIIIIILLIIFETVVEATVTVVGGRIIIRVTFPFRRNLITLKVQSERDDDGHLLQLSEEHPVVRYPKKRLCLADNLVVQQ